MKPQVLLIICDGWGYRKEKKYNAIAHAKKPNFDYLWKNYPRALLKASGEAIGLPEGQIGTSEANHLIIGSGRILYQNLLRINHSIKNNSFFENQALKEAFDHVKKFKSVLHIKGMVSPGGVHGHMNHIKALIQGAKQEGIQKIMLHLFTDGRDVPPKSAITYVRDLEQFLKMIGVGKIATVGGRYWGMDRDNNEDRIEKHFRVMVVGEGKRFKSPVEVIADSYKNSVTDEFIEPALIVHENNEIGCIQSNDAVVFANFRADRARQITKRFIKEQIRNLKYIAMTKYADDIDVRVAFPPEEIKNTLSEILSKNRYKQLRITETDKFTHLTFFFNAQRYKPDPLEDRVMIPTNKDVKTHDQKPEMKAMKITNQIVEAIENKTHDFIATNIVNADMVGHSGNYQATVQAVEVIDKAFGFIIEAARKHNAIIMITADHGNAEEMYNQEINQPHTAHTLNPVPFLLFSEKYKKINHQTGLLSDVAPTILKIFGIPIPKEMTGKPFV
jgi:2,3-bisphosphoglycerate-independent phosphoglycerate mutase